VLGLTGLSAYISLVILCKAKLGETVVITSAAGQIGHLAGQIGKILGLNVIGNYDFYIESRASRLFHS